MALSQDPEKRARQLANLKPAKPGEVRNPTGSQGPDPLRRAFRDKMTPELAEKIAEVGVSFLRSGNLRALQIYFQEVEPLPKDVNLNQSGRVVVEFVDVEDWRAE